MVTLKTFTILLPVSKGGLLVEMNCSYQLRKEIMANVFFHSCSYVLPSCFLFFLLRFRKLKSSLASVVFGSYSQHFPFSPQLLSAGTCLFLRNLSKELLLLYSMPNRQNLVNNSFEAKMDLQHGRSDKVVSRSLHSTQIR